MAIALLRPGDGERRINTRFELVTWASVHRTCGKPAGKVLVSDISQGGFNMQSRWDFAARENLFIEVTPLAQRGARIVWHESQVGAYGCRFALPLGDHELAEVLAALSEDPGQGLIPAASTEERRGEQRFEMRVPITARRGAVIESEVVMLTNLSVSGFRIRSSQEYVAKQTIYVELGVNLLAEARIVRREHQTGEYAACFSYSLAPRLLDRLVASHIAAT